MTNIGAARETVVLARAQLLAATAENKGNVVGSYIAASGEFLWADYRRRRDVIETEWLTKIRPESEPKTQALIDFRLAQLADKTVRTGGFNRQTQVLYQLF
jgi:hypothetical protein